MGHDRHTIPPAAAGRTTPRPAGAATALIDDAILDRLRARIAAGDAEGLGQSAHRLKGSCLNLGARRMSELRGGLEHLAGAGDLDPAAGALAELERAFAATRDELRARLVAR